LFAIIRQALGVDAPRAFRRELAYPVSLTTVAALGQGQKPECARCEARGGGGLGTV